MKPSSLWKSIIDLIVTKLVSRFARNTVDSLTTVRKLKDRGIEIYFEKENIWTLDAKGELLITIMSSLAQEESRSISENVTWGHRKRFTVNFLTKETKANEGEVPQYYDYDRNYNELVSRYEVVKTQYDKACEAIQYRKARSRQMDSFIQELQEQELIKEFDARLWGSMVDFITVYSKDDIRVICKDGTEIRA